MAHLLKSIREQAGLTQSELASRAGVSRQMIGAIEAGRHLPRVDAALALAQALETDVGEVFGRRSTPVDAVSGAPTPAGSMVRVGWVGDLPVTAPAGLGTHGWGVADGTVRNGELVVFDRRPRGLVVAGCEPGLEVLEQMLRESGMASLSASSSTAAARAALTADRVHAAVVHGPRGDGFPKADGTVTRVRLARWQVGLSAPRSARAGWPQRALSGREPVIQREPGAGVQQVFLSAAGVGDDGVPGPVVASHLEAAKASVAIGLPAVTIEPAALAVGARFHPLEVHDAELWISKRWYDEPFVARALATIHERRFRSRLEGIGGYDLSGSGARIT